MYITFQQKQKSPSTPKKGGRQVLTDAKAKAQEVARKAELGRGVDQEVVRLNGIYCVYIYIHYRDVYGYISDILGRITIF